MSLDQKYTAASTMYKRCELMQEACIASGDGVGFVKYHKIALRLIQYRCNIIIRERQAIHE